MTKKEKMAFVAAAVYMAIMMLGMYTMKHIYGIEYSQPQMVTILVYFMPFSMASALFFYYKYFRGMALNRPRINLWIVEFFIAAIILAFLQIHYGDYAGKDMTLVWTIVATTFMVGIGEEMLFRGIIFNAFKEKRGAYPAILMSAVIFGLLHITNILGGESVPEAMIQSASAGMSGIFFAWVFFKTKNVIPTMIYHWVWDMFLIMGLYVHVDQTSHLLMFQNLFEMSAALVILVTIMRTLVKNKE